ncbi:ABC transporter ATP-binding protein [Dictyobacter aurantiacus]|uniref:Putative ABC transporter ATP-binding protein YhaQ n=1 Tax=Dictyobacter aurantiacus TaxID=1936993 RepID=A0A401ZS16_9CHLR|nr:ATP-binding cassette domain-containing protein [Dictyobacter aurantiacus]GCE09570.1 putative ABC transporter ATP-binding protein YhaQ [Dictyobacter aurantiacus]
MGLVVDTISKSFGQFQAVKDLSMEVKEGALFGLLGANGAGKTTTMRMVLDIFRPDRGQITWNGKDVREIPRRELGYLPEERGLYSKMSVEEQLLFLAQLNGLSKRDAKSAMDEWLDRFQINANRKKKIEDLSKGNQQKIQFLATILHNPSILIMDEPFSGLDPVNAIVLKDAFLEMHRRGKTIIFSTHQLDQVEEMCEDIVIMNKGEAVVEGSVQEVRRQHGRNIVRLKLENDPQALWLDDMDGVQVTKRRQDYIEMQIRADLDPNVILETALQHSGQINRFELAEPSLTDIFIERVGNIALPDAPTTVA